LFLTVQNSTALENIWMIKPTDTNRGKGIKLFSRLEQFMSILQDFGKTTIIREKLLDLGVLGHEGEFYSGF